MPPSPPSPAAARTEWRDTGLSILLAWLPLWRLWPLDRVLLQHDLYLSDLLHTLAPYREALGQSLRAGRLPGWWPAVYSGVPLYAQIEAGVLYPPRMLLALLAPGPIGVALAILLASAVAAEGARRLGRSLGLSRMGSLLAALVFAAGGFQVGHLHHPEMRAAAAWLPWALWCARAGALGGDGSDAMTPRRGRAWPWLSAILALQLLAGMPQMSWLTLLALGVQGLWLAARERDPRPLLPLAAAVALGFALSALWLWPCWLAIREAPRAAGATWGHIRAYGVGVRDLLTLFWPRAAGSPYEDRYYGASFLWENYAWAGLLTLPLALWGWWRADARGRGRGWLLAGAAALLVWLLHLGAATPLFGLAFRTLPGLSLFRFPQRFLLLHLLLLAMAAGRGLSLLRPRWRRPGLALLALDLTIAHQFLIPVDSAAAWRDPGPLVAAIQQADPERRWRSYQLDDWRPWLAAHIAHQGVAAEGLAPFRALAGLPLGSRGARWGLRSPGGGLVNVLPARSARFWFLIDDFLPESHLPPRVDADGAPDPVFQSLLERASVRWWIAPDDTPVLHRARFPERARQPGYSPAQPPDGPRPPPGYRLHEARWALPRAWLARSWTLVGGLQDAAGWLHGPGRALSWVPAVEQAPPPGLGPRPLGGRPPATTPAAEGAGFWSPLAWEEPRPEELRVSVPAGAAGLVVVTDSLASGWHAELDGAEVPIVAVNGWQRGVWVEPAEDERALVLRYRVPGLPLGLGVSGLALLLWLGWLGWWRRGGRG